MAFQTILARLGVNLSLDTAAFETGARKARTEVKGLESTMQKAGKAIAVAGGALLAAGVFQEVKRLATAGLEYASSLGEVATQLGVTASELQEYRYVASQVGIEQDQMDKGLAKLSITLGDLAAGAEAPRKALEQLGFTASEIDEISRMTAGDALPKLADGFAKIESPTKRAAIAADLFGAKMGPRFLSLLEGGAAGINGLRDAAHDLGIVLSDEQIQNADETADKMAQLKQVLEARIAGVVADNADSIYALADALATVTVEAASALGNYITFVKALSRNGGLRGQLASVLPLTAGVAGLFGGGDGARDPLPADMSFAGIMGYRPKPTGAAAGAGSSAARSGGRGGSSGAAAAQRAELDRLSDAAESAEIRSAAAALGISGAFEKMSDDTRAALRRAFPELDKLIDYRREYAALEKDGLIDQRRTTDAERALRVAFGGIDLNNIWTDIADFGGRDPLEESLSRSDRALEAFVERSKINTVKIAKSFKEMADDTLSSLSRLSSAIEGGSFLGILEAVIGVGLQLGGLGVFGKRIQTNLNKVPGNALGTASAGRGLSWVGERGPELVDFRGGERVHNARDSRKMMGSGLLEFRNSSLLDVYLDGKLVAAAGPIAMAGAQGGVSLMRHRQSRTL